MVCLVDFQTIQIHPNKPIGSVIFIVEGSKNEFSLLKHIFTNVLGYHYIEKRRSKDQFYEKQDKLNEVKSRIAVVNTETSNIKSIEDEHNFLDEIMQVLSLKYEFDIDNSAIFYIFDRDPQSNKDALRIKKYIEKFIDPYENDTFERGGLILLSYPAIEAYLISNFKEDFYKEKIKIGNKLKTMIGGANGEIEIKKITDATLCHALHEMLKYFHVQQEPFQIDAFASTNLSIFEKQEKCLQEYGAYHCLSCLSVAFLYLGILEIRANK